MESKAAEPSSQSNSFQRYERKIASMPKQADPDFILEPNPEGAAISDDKLKALEKNDSSTSHSNECVGWVKQYQDNVVFWTWRGESLCRIRVKKTRLETNLQYERNGVGTIQISGPAQRILKRRFRERGEHVRTAARQISGRFREQA